MLYKGQMGKRRRRVSWLRVTQRGGGAAGMKTGPASAPLTTQRLDGAVDPILGLVCVFSVVDDSKVA